MLPEFMNAQWRLASRKDRLTISKTRCYDGIRAGAVSRSWHGPEFGVVSSGFWVLDSDFGLFCCHF